MRFVAFLALSLSVNGCAELTLLQMGGQAWEAERREERIKRGLEPGPEVIARCGRESVRGVQPNVTFDEDRYNECMAREGWPKK